MTFTDIEEKFHYYLDLSYSPAVKIHPIMKVMTLIPVGSHKDAIIPGKTAPLELVDIPHNKFMWKQWKYPHANERFPYGKDSHQVVLRKAPSPMGAAVVLAIPNYDNPDVEATCPFNEQEIVLGFLAKKAEFFEHMFSDGRIGPGRVTGFKKLHNGKFEVPVITFPYGPNSFEEELGDIEELVDTTTEYPTYIETEMIMDDFDD